jgi:hypothetical protein
MDGKDRIRVFLRRPGDCGFEIAGAHQSCLRIDVGKDDLGAREMRRACGRDEGYGWHDDRVAPADAERACGEIQRRRAVGTRDRLAGADGPRQRAFEILDKGAGGEEIAAQRVGYGRDVVVLDELPSIGDERRRLCGVRAFDGRGRGLGAQTRRLYA